jgi:hypothetical protein
MLLAGLELLALKNAAAVRLVKIVEKIQDVLNRGRLFRGGEEWIEGSRSRIHRAQDRYTRTRLSSPREVHGA